MSTRTRIGAVAWMACAQYFVAEVVAARGFAGHYSVATNYISDLGAVHCARLVCSPLHWLMNSSFLLQGLLIAAGAVLSAAVVPEAGWRRIVCGLFVVSGIGVLLVGLAPEDVAPPIHFLGALCHFLGGGAAMLLAGVWLWRNPKQRVGAAITLTAGTLTVTATLLLPAHQHLGWPAGLVERVAAYPFTLWLVAAGLWFFLVRERVAKR